MGLPGHRCQDFVFIQNPIIIIYMNIPSVMDDSIEEGYMYENILALIKSIYGLVQGEHCWFN